MAIHNHVTLTFDLRVNACRAIAVEHNVQAYQVWC